MTKRFLLIAVPKSSLKRAIPFIVGTPTPLIKGGGRTFEKFSHLGGVRNFLLESGDKPERGGGGDVEMEGLPLFLLLYSSVQSHLYFQIFSL